MDIDGYFQLKLGEESEPLNCLVMEKIEGLNLAQYIKQRGYRPIKPKRALRWLAELSLILERVHNHNFFHRDIKPGNIMLRPNGCLALIDFGTAREVTDSYIQKQKLGEVTGVVSQGYTPIEQMKGKAVLQSDFYALGGTIVFLLTAQNPGSFYNVTDDRFNWRGSVKDISPQFADLIDYMMAFSPAQRPSSSREIFNRAIAINSSLKVLAEDLNPTQRDIPQNQRQIETSSIVQPITQPIPPAIPQHNTFEKYQPERSGSNSSFSDRQADSPNFSANAPADSQFIAQARQELAEFIGPIANIVCNRAVRENPNLSKMELCLTLAKSIGDPVKAKTFQQRLQRAID